MIVRRIVAVFLLLAGSFVASAAHASPIASRIPAVADYLNRLDRLGFDGAVLIAEGDSTLLAAGYGLADRERNVPWSPTTISTIGSITKQFTGAAILALAEDGKVSVDDPVTKYFPDVPPDKRGITMHQLLTHSSGIVDLEGLDDWDPIDRDAFIARAMAQPLAFDPGDGYAYSNAGYSLLGAIIEQVTGESWEAYLRRRFFLPAGMRDTGYILAGWDPSRLAQGYRGTERWGTVLERPMADDGPYWVLRANGGVYSTVLDMLRWARRLLDGRALSPDSMERYWTGYVDEGGGESRYGYGWVVMDAAGTRIITHNGGNGILFADMAIVPAAGLVVVLQCNVVGDFHVAEQLLRQIGYHLLAGDPLPDAPDVADTPPADLASWSGRYALDSGGACDVRVAGSTLEVEPVDPPGFSALLSERPVDDARARRFSARIDTLAGAWLAGDLGPMWEAYGGRVSREVLELRAREQMAEWTDAVGTITGHRVLGTAFRIDRDETVVRFLGERGTVDRTYVWDKDAENRLLGVSGRGLDPVLHALPERGGGYATWDSRSGASTTVTFSPVEGGGALMLLGSTAPLRARRAP